MLLYWLLFFWTSLDVPVLTKHAEITHWGVTNTWLLIACLLCINKKVICCCFYNPVGGATNWLFIIDWNYISLLMELYGCLFVEMYFNIWPLLGCYWGKLWECIDRQPRVGYCSNNVNKSIKSSISGTIKAVFLVQECKVVLSKGSFNGGQFKLVKN